MMIYIRAKKRGATLRNLGIVRGIGYDGKLIVKGKYAPKLKTDVFDTSSINLGKVVKVFGSINSPFILIKLMKNRKPSLDIIGKKVFVDLISL